MLKHVLLIISSAFLCSCGGGENSSPTQTTEPVVVSPPREVEISLPEKLIANEKTTLKIDLSLTGSILSSDSVMVTTNSPLVVAQINNDRNLITVDVADVTLDADVKVKVSVEGPSNAPSKEVTISIINASANLFIQELNKIIAEVNRSYKYNEELHVAKMLSLISAIKTNDIEKFEIIFKSFLEKLEENQGEIITRIQQYQDAIIKYQEKSIDENNLRFIYVNSEISKNNYNSENISALNTLLTELAIPIEFPLNADSTESNFIGNSKIGSYIGDKFIFNTKYYYLNSILDKSCIGS